MAADIYSAVIAASGATIIAGLTYWFTKQREREAELRKEKLEHYKDFVVCLSNIAGEEISLEAQRAYSLSCNKLNLVAPHPVLRALQAFQRETKSGNKTTSIERHNELMSRLFYEIRKDLGVSPKDKSDDFEIGLWASGKPSKRIEK
jgi:hypothetical protein